MFVNENLPTIYGKSALWVGIECSCCGACIRMLGGVGKSVLTFIELHAVIVIIRRLNITRFQRLVLFFIINFLLIKNPLLKCFQLFGRLIINIVILFYCFSYFRQFYTTIIIIGCVRWYLIYCC